jgi:hypothetical protein
LSGGKHKVKQPALKVEVVSGLAVTSGLLKMMPPVLNSKQITLVSALVVSAESLIVLQHVLMQTAILGHSKEWRAVI